MLNSIFTLIKKLNYVAYMYGVLYIYNGVMGGYPAMVFYHIRGAYEWVSNYVPVYALFTIISIVVAWFALSKIRNI